MTTVFDQVVSVLEADGRDVNIQPQEKQAMYDQRELILLVEDVDIEVESTTTYIIEPTCIVIYQVLNANDVLTTIPEISKLIEDGISSVCGFKILKPNVEILGTAYNIGIRFSYKDVITIE